MSSVEQDILNFQFNNHMNFKYRNLKTLAQSTHQRSCLLKGENLSPVIIHLVKMHHLAIHQVYLDRSYVVV